MNKLEREFIINKFEKWREECLKAVEEYANDKHLATYYTGHAAGYFEAIHYLKYKHEKEIENV